MLRRSSDLRGCQRAWVNCELGSILSRRTRSPHALAHRPRSGPLAWAHSTHAIAELGRSLHHHLLAQARSRGSKMKPKVHRRTVDLPGYPGLSSFCLSVGVASFNR